MTTATEEPKVTDLFGNPLEPLQQDASQVRKVYHKGQPYWVLCDVALILNGKTKRGVAVARSIPKRFVRKIDVLTAGGKQGLLAANLQGMLWYASRTRTGPKEILKSIGRHRSTSLMSNWKETEVVDVLFQAFSSLGPVRQYSCQGYKIDLYLKGPRIAIECDEHAHAYYGKQAEQEREDAIRQALSCTFIRFDPDHPGFAVGSLIDSIVRQIVDDPHRGKVIDIVPRALPSA